MDNTSNPESIEPKKVALFTHNLVLDPEADPVGDLAYLPTKAPPNELTPGAGAPIKVILSDCDP